MRCVRGAYAALSIGPASRAQGSCAALRLQPRGWGDIAITKIFVGTHARAPKYSWIPEMLPAENLISDHSAVKGESAAAARSSGQQQSSAAPPVQVARRDPRGPGLGVAWRRAAGSGQRPPPRPDAVRPLPARPSPTSAARANAPSPLPDELCMREPPRRMIFDDARPGASKTLLESE